MCKFWLICSRSEFVMESWLTSLLPTPSSYNISNKSSELIIIRLHNFASNWVQSTHFSQEIFPGKIDCYYCVPAVFYLTITFQKNYQRPNHLTMLHNFGPNLAWVDLSIKNEFIGKVDQHVIGLLYPVMLHNLKKNSPGADYKVA